jgi:prepilin-type N-terminal cleavage/methylation domain-containing protein
MLNKLRRRAEDRADDGMSLVEVIVSLTILALVMAAAALFFINGLKTTSAQAQRQNAVQVANLALENTASQTPTQLLKGRTSGCVGVLLSAQGGAALTAQDVKTSGNYELLDPTTTCPSATIPTSQTKNINNVSYTIRTYIDLCYLDAAASSCTPTSVVGSQQLYRVTVDATWAPTKGESCLNYCHYSASTLIDSHGEPQFNTNLSTPVVTGLAPSAVLSGQTKNLVLSGSGFLAGATVTITSAAGGTLGAVASNTGTAITVPFTAGATPGTYTLRIVNPDGGNTTTTVIVTPLPTISGFSLASLRNGTSSSVTITGTGFQSGVAVDMTSGTVTGVTYVSATSITGTFTPNGTQTGSASITVTNPDTGAASASLSLLVSQPTATSASQSATNALGTPTSITVTGTNFLPGASFRASTGTVGATSLLTSTTAVFAFTPSAANASTTFTLTNPDGPTASTSRVVATKAAPTITDFTILTNSGKKNQVTMQMTGTGFVSTAAVGLTWTGGSGTATSVVVKNATTITMAFDFPDNTFSMNVTFTLTNGDGQIVSFSKVISL